MNDSISTLYGITVNKQLLWDFSWTARDYNTEIFFKWYLARLLANGTADDLRGIDFEIIKKYLNDLVGVPRFIREFWEWFLQR